MAAIIPKWRCPLCKRWVREPMGRRCVACRGAAQPEVVVFAGTAEADRTNPRLPRVLRTAPQALKEDTDA